MLTEAGDPKKLIRTTYWTRFDQSLRDDEHENLEMITTEGATNNGKMMMHFDHDDDEGKDYHQQKDVDSETSSHSSIETEEDICPEECCLPPKKDVNHNKDDVENCHTSSRDCPGKVCSWFCGLDGEASSADTKQNEHLEKLTCLEQNSTAKTFLNINLIIILLLGFALFAVFSIKGHWQLEFWYAE